MIEPWPGGVVEPRLLLSLSTKEDPAREAGRSGKGGSSEETYVSNYYIYIYAFVISPS